MKRPNTLAIQAYGTALKGGRLIPPSDIGATLKRARKSKGLTQLQLAKLAGVSMPTVFHYESGYRNNIAMLVRLFGALGLAVGFCVEARE